jgi:acetaldehyde dehydrogenase/alcohol dehydrogenase
MTIKEAGVTEEKFYATLDDMSEQAFDDQCTGANPRYPLISELKQMYINVFDKPAALKEVAATKETKKK